LDVTAPLGTTTQFTGVNPADGTPITVTNLMTDFGWEYVWHCHLLGHEENDMMRPLVMRVQSTAPTIPQSLTATIAGPPLAVNLNWFPPSVANQTSYQLQRVTGASGGTFTNIAVLSSVTTAYSDTAVAPNTTYRYRVIAVNGAGSSLPSNVASITTPALPAAPSNLTATLAPGTRYAILNWRINGGLATGFIVTRTGGAGPVTFTLGAGVATMTDAALDPGVTYTYTVVAFDAAGNSTASPSASLTTPALPGMATNLRLVNVSATQATIAWNAGAPGTQTGFFVWRSTDGGATWTLATSTSQLGYVATGLTSGRNYRFRVQAWNAFGIAPTSSTLQVNTP
jgi:predicted phage tail protein